MRAMKDSGIEWIGEIPQEWKIIRAKHIASISNGADPKTEGNTPVYGSGETSFKSCGEHKEGPAVLIGRKGATLHIPHYVEGRYWNVDTAFDVKMLSDQFDLKYYYALAICFDYKSYTATTTLPSMTQTNYGNMYLPFPTLHKQKQIISYLETKCAEIDALIAAKEKTNALLKERRQSIIYEAVTKGLDPTVPMKDSGVEWIGEIPEGWRVCRIKRVATIVTGNTPSKASGDLNYSDDGLIWVKPDNLNGSIPVSDTNEHLSEEGRKLAKTVPACTPLICCIGTIGKAGYADQEAAFNQQINAICYDESVDLRFGLYCLMSQEEQQKCYANGNVLKILNAETQGILFIALPPISDQKAIAQYLDEQCLIIDNLCASNDIAIQKLKEYRQSLIYEAVTGKIEV